MEKGSLNIIITIILILGSVILSGFQDKQAIYTCKNGQVNFLSDAPLEMIKASSKNLTGALNLKDRSFSFLLFTKTFEGFNSSLQRTHFNEDYMETDIYPSSTFKGKIIEEIDISVPGTYKIRAKGKMYIHGIENDRIVRCDLIVSENKIDVKASFTVFLTDHKITIPSILNQKIAEEIKVDISFTLTPAAN
jgi:hypothetical protein